jgi:hypothetical protein
MLWKEVKSWSKEKGFKTDRTKIQDEENSYHYTWFKIDNPSISGTATSVSKLATIIYNNITDNKYLEYQQEYQAQQTLEDFKYE